MRIESVRLINIRSYADQKIRFFPGVNFISGANGAGKTTIIESIGWALFGAQPIGTIEDNLRSGAKKGEIHVEFTIDGERLTVKRLIGTASSRRVYDALGEELDLHNDRDVNDFVKEKLKIAGDEDLASLFCDVIGVRQGSFALPFLEQPAERKRIFNKVLRLDSYARAERNSAELKELVKEKLNGLDKQYALDEQIAQEEEPVRLALFSIDRQLNEIAVESERLQREEAEEQTRADAQKQAREAAQRALQAHALAEEIARSAQHTAEEKQTQLTEAKQAQQALESLQSAYDAYAAAQQQQQALDRQRAERDELSTRNTQLDKAIIELEKEIEYGEQSLRDSIASGETALRQADELDRDLDGRQEQSNTAAAELQSEHKALDQEKSKLALSEDRRTMLNKYGESLLRGVAMFNEAESKWTAIQSVLGRAAEIETLCNALNDSIENERKAVEEFSAANQRLLTLTSDAERFSNGRCPYTDGLCNTVESLKEQAEQEIRTVRSQIDALAQTILTEKEWQAVNADARKEQVLLDDARAHRESAWTQRNECIKKFVSLAALIRSIGGEDAEYTALFEQFDDWLRSPSSEGLRALEAAMERARIEAERVVIAARETITEREKTAAQESARQTAQMQTIRLERERNARIKTAAQEELRQGEQKRLLIETQKEQLREQKRKRETLQRELARFDGLEEQLQAVHALLTRNESDYQQYISLRALAARLEALAVEYEALRLVAQQAQQDEERKAAQLQEAKLAYNPQEENGAIEQLRRIRNSMAEKRGEQRALTEQQAKERQNAQRIETAKERIALTMQKMNSLQKTQTLLMTCLKMLKNTGERMAVRYRERLSLEANRLYRAMSAEAATLQWTDDYDIRLTDTHAGRERRRVFRQLSGGEQMSAALALRLALLTQLSGAGIAFFDEPTTNLDANRRKLLSDVLPSVTREFEQIFVVSHDDTFDAMSENIITLRRGKDGTELESVG